MHITSKCLIVAIVMVFSSHQQTAGQTAGKIPYKDGSREQRQVQMLINHSITSAERMLVKQGAYVPYAAALTTLDSIVNIAMPPDYQNQDLKHILSDIKAALKTGADQGLYKAVAMFFDVTITDPATGQPSEAIAIFTEQINSIGSYTYYYPYKKTGPKGITYSKSFGTMSDNEIFTKVSKD